MIATNPGWEVRYHQPSQHYMLYIPAGADPTDGQPMTYATPLTPDEALLWQQGSRDSLAARLRLRGIPLPQATTREPRWRRFLKGLRRKLLGRR